MQDLKEIAISNLQVHPLFYYRYVDDIFSHFYLNTLTILFLIFYKQGYNLPWRLAMTIDWIFLTPLIIDNKRIIFDTYQNYIFRKGSWISIEWISWISIILFVIKEAYIYKITCDDCEDNYIGQTKRKLGTRICEHISDINKKTGSPSVISDHRINLNHNFRWK